MVLDCISLKKINKKVNWIDKVKNKGGKNEENGLAIK